MLNSLKLEKELQKVRADHEAIEKTIAEEIRKKVVNQFEVQKLKKEKLALKERIAEIEARLVDDIVA
jgi:hypothetical protein